VNINAAFQARAANGMITTPPIPPWVSLSGNLAPFASFVVTMAPLPTIRDMAKEKNVGKMPLLPYSSMFVNCFVWSVYGLLKFEKKVYITNMIGCILGLYYFLQFNKICPSDAKNLPFTKNHHKWISTCIIAFTSICALAPAHISTTIIGKMGLFFCVVLFGSPLSSLKNVIATKSAKTIPLPFTLACCVNCFLWSVFGILEAKDFNIYFPNVLGLMLGLVQLLLWALYGKGPPRFYQDDTKLPI